MPRKQADKKSAKSAAIRLLARRDHGREELRVKLARRGFEDDKIAAALDALDRAGLLDDEKVARSYAAEQLARGHGPNYIRAGLRRRGLSGQKPVIPQEEEAASLRALLERRGIDPAELTDLERRAKIYRFLLARGYTRRAVAAAMEGRDNG
ncbi:MAG: RecX family transcriptional regulator [Acidobacteriota bacterium]|jgi:regulatory protein